MRVLVIHNRGNSALPSGESVVVERDVESLRSAGVEVEVEYASHEVSPPLYRAPRALVDLFWSSRSFDRTLRLIRDFEPDVVHVHSVLPSLSASVFHAARSRGVATVQTLHNYRWVCIEGGLLRDGEYCAECLGTRGFRGVRARCARDSTAVSLALAANNLAHVRSGSLARVVDRFVCVSRFVRERHLEAGFPADRTVVRYNTIPAIAEPVGPEAPVPRSVCFVGRLDRGKGADLLPALAARLHDHSFEIIGVGPLARELRRQVGELGLETVSFQGHVDRSEVTAALRRSAVVVVPSRAAESFGLVAAEAMACAVAVVVSDRGALPELAGASGGGLVASPDVAALAEKIRQVTSSESLRERLSSAGRRFAERELCASVGARRLIEIYQGVARP